MFWAYDCLLGLKQYESYLEKTEPKNPFGTSTHASNLRLNIQRKIGVEADPVDIFLMAGGRKTKFITSNQALYRDKVREVFLAFPKEKGHLVNVFEGWDYIRQSYPHLLFNGAVVPENPEMEFLICAYYFAYEHLNTIKGLSKEA